MRLTVRHQTAYHYEQPIAAAAQVLRLSPRPYQGLTVHHWSVRAGHRNLRSFVDGFGNVTHCHYVNAPHTEAVISVEGEVETTNTYGIVRGASEPLPPAFFLRQTALTRPDAAIADLARSVTGKVSVLKQLHALLNAVRDRVDYRVGATDSDTSAAEALASGAGVCQDHTHILIAAARYLGIPARYIGGYLWTSEEMRDYQATHAWAEAFVHDLGWVGFDPSNRICPTEAYIRTGVGLDYASAAPVRGIRRGGTAENLDVKVSVTQAGGEQQ